MYEELIAELRHYFDGVPLVMQAADAIEELQLYEGLYQELAEKNGQTARKVLDAYPRWISVEERLPEMQLKADEVGVWEESDPVVAVAPSAIDGRPVIVSGQFVAERGKFFFRNDTTWNTGGPTQWMPLPEPPKEE